MKKLLLLKRASLALFSFLLVAACSSDDGGGSSPLDGVPKGEIVAVGERQKALTGYEDGAAPRNTESQKWWKYIQGYYQYNCAGENESEEIESSGEYFAFFPNGKLYYRYGLQGEPIFHSDWEWTDSSKTKIRLIDLGESQEFQVTELNANGVVYASYISEQGCSFLSWEKLGEPVFE